MSIEYESCYSSNKLIERLEKLQQEGYIFRGQSDARWPIIPNAFREASLKKFQKDFPAGLDSWRWSESDEANQTVRSHLKVPIQKLPPLYARQHKLLSQYLVYLMQYNHSITQYYCNAISDGQITEQQLPETARNLLKHRSPSYWAEKNTFIRGLDQVLLTATPNFDRRGRLLNKPYLEQELTGYDETWPQHYGFPSAAIDWSKNLHVALYFANHKDIDSDLNVERAQSESLIQIHAKMPDEIPSHFAIFCYKEINDQDSSIKIMMPDNSVDNPRAVVQQGIFTYFAKPFLFFLDKGKFPSVDAYENENKFRLIKLSVERTKKDVANIKQLLLSKEINGVYLLLK